MDFKPVKPQDTKDTNDRLANTTNLELINRCKGEFIDPVASNELRKRGLRLNLDYHNPYIDLLATRYETTTPELYKMREISYF